MSLAARAADADGEADFAILGAGAIGAILGAHLWRAGHSVIMLVREARAQQIRMRGVRITGLAEIHAPLEALSDWSQLRRARTLVVAMKTPGTDAALQALRHAEFATAFSIQNGTLKNELLAHAFGTDPVLGAVADTSGELQPDGAILFTRNVNLLIGELSGDISARSTRIAAQFAAAGIRSAAVTHIRDLEWSKFAAWVGLMVVAVMTRAVTWKFLCDPGSALVLVRLVREMGELARRSGVALTDQAVLPTATICSQSEENAVRALMEVGLRFRAEAPGHRLSALQDFEGRRPLELNETLGYALENAARLQLALPLVAAFHALLGALERAQQRSEPAQH